MKVDAFDFDLPASRIALRPVRPRDAARLLVVGRRGRCDRAVTELPDLLAPGDLLVFNDTRVLPARLRGRRRGAAIEVTLIGRLGHGAWSALARPARKLKPGDEIAFAPDLRAAVTARGAAGAVTLAFACGEAALAAALRRHGEMPLPPYIGRRRPVDARDAEDYQTVFAARDGAVAAPTAGLHFTPRLLAALDRRGLSRAAVTLHVGAGTFLPVRVDDTDDHAMAAEWGTVPEATAAAVNAARARGNRVVAVGSTALRLLETAAAGGAAGGAVGRFSGDTDLFVTPGYRFRAVDAMVTNFHLPRSTLFMLVCAFAGFERMHAAYVHAREAGYRFYSYGDACLLGREAP